MSHVPCVGCGWCCLSDQCQVSHLLHGYLPRCPELLWDAALGRYLCLLMAPRHPASGVSSEASRPGRPCADTPDASRPAGDAPGPDLTELRQGLGCCAPLCSWRHDVRDRG
ncbi:hypothetical protein [Nitratidesulfovibrio termitidis]|uniref:hypothetical protein n=1 Tax=Nitratidesulfovibrio termitidis TaxID=42252 RepID=UPI00040AD13B|nr:hypothetical protein [Nitratidesulfovibrio termitidis]